MRELMVPVFLDGKCVYTSPSVMAVSYTHLSNKVTFIDFGTLYMLINLLMLLLIFLLNKHHIGISTFVNIFLLGYVVQFSDDVVAGLVGDSPSMPVLSLIHIWSVLSSSSLALSIRSMVIYWMNEHPVSCLKKRLT